MHVCSMQSLLFQFIFLVCREVHIQVCPRSNTYLAEAALLWAAACSPRLYGKLSRPLLESEVEEAMRACNARQAEGWDQLGLGA